MEEQQIQRLDYLIEKFKIDLEDYKNLQTPTDVETKQSQITNKIMLRGSARFKEWGSKN